MKFEAVIFDLDGTLIDTLEDISDAMNMVLENHAYSSHTYQQYKFFIGKGIKKLVEQALPSNQRTEKVIEACFSEMMQVYQQNCLNKTKMYEGIKEVLRELKEKDMPMAVFSNKNHELTLPIVNDLIGQDIFKIILGAQSSFPTKPSPDGAILISKELGIAPEKIAYIGDTDTDMKTANAAGMYAIGVLWGFREREELIANGAKITIEHPHDLLELFVQN